MMPKITIVLAGVPRGPFTEEVIHVYLTEGIILPTDQARLGEEEEMCSVTEALARMPRYSSEKGKRRKRKSSSKERWKQQKKWLVLGSYLVLALGLILLIIFEKNICDFFDTVNRTHG